MKFALFCRRCRFPGARCRGAFLAVESEPHRHGTISLHSGAGIRPIAGFGLYAFSLRDRIEALEKRLELIK